MVQNTGYYIRIYYMYASGLVTMEIIGVPTGKYISCSGSLREFVVYIDFQFCGMLN